MNGNSIEIDLVDMLKEVFKKWKVILICVLLCVVLFGIYGLFQSKRVANIEKEIATLKASLTEEQIKDVEDAAEIINSYRDMYIKQKEYNDNSIYQNLNPYNVDTLILSYYVDNHYQVSYPVIQESNNLVSMVQTYTSFFTEDDFYNELAKACGSNIAPTYMKELITVDVGDYEESTFKESGVIIIYIYADGNELLNDIGDFVKNKIISKKDEITELYGNHDITLTSETISKTVDPDMALVQSNNIKRLSDITTNISNTEKVFSGTQRTYLGRLVHENIDNDTSILKMVVIGALVGVVVSCAYLCLAYIFSKTVKTSNELVNIFKLNVLGSLDDNEDVLISKIKKVVEINGAKNIAIVTKETDDKIDSFVNTLGKQFVLTIDVLNNKEAFDKFAVCDSVILIEGLKKSKRRDIKGVLNTCNDLNVKVLGVLLK